MKTRLSVAMIVKNAAPYLDRCLRSVTWADEIVVLDGYSTDGSQEIARRFGARVLEKDFESFPAERTHVLAHTAHDWVLSLDADMIVPPDLAREIQDLMARGPEYDGYRMRCLNHFLGREIRHCSWFDPRFLRLFDKRKGAYDQTAKVLDLFLCTGRVGTLQHHLIHHQTETLEEYLEKLTHRYARMTADEYLTKGVRITRWNLPWYLVLKPWLVFLYKYVLKRGFLDGVPGFLICVNSAILYYFIFSIIWDRQRGRPDYHLERYLPHVDRPKRRSENAMTGEDRGMDGGNRS